jgi:hypothetical protein
MSRIKALMGRPVTTYRTLSDLSDRERRRLLVMPGGMLALPVLAWWLDRRRNRRPAGSAAHG